jgi:diguanylate cyclase (GGDEF)-like protein
VADDDRLVLSTLCAGLARAGYRVEAATSGADAVRACETNPPDLMVLDVDMPGMSGMDVARRIRENSDTPILLLTAYDDANLVQEAAALRLNGYFVKPTDSTQLVPSIEMNLMRTKTEPRARSDEPRPPVNDAHAGRDPLTGLVNREGLTRRLSEVMSQAARQNNLGVCLCLDIDRFRAVVSNLGLHTSNLVLQQVVQLVRSQLRQTDVLARVGEDQFFVLLPEMSLETAATVTRRMLASLGDEPFYTGQRPLRLTASAGLSLFDGSEDPEIAVTRAFAALQEAKTIGPGSLSILHEGEVTTSAGEWQLQRQIRTALDHDRIGVEFQPILDMTDGAVRHYEALLRLRDDRDAVVPVSDFLPTAERCGLIRDLDYRVLDIVIRHLVAAQAARRDACIAVNLSGAHFGSPALLRRIRGILDESGVDVRRLIFEVTESAAVRDLKQASRFIAELKALGCQFALDDFGVGYASFHYLKELPVDFIKIDGAFVRDLARTATDRLFVKAMVEVAKGLGVRTVAECVGDAETLTLLKSYGVDFAQGYHIGRPGPFPDLSSQPVTGPSITTESGKQ